MRHRETAPPTGVAAIGRPGVRRWREAIPVALERLVEFALRHQHAANAAVRHREIVLPTGVAAIGGGQALGDGEAIPVALSASRSSLPCATSTPPMLRYDRREIALPTGVAAIGGGQALTNGELIPVARSASFVCPAPPARADLVVRHRRSRCQPVLSAIGGGQRSAMARLSR